MASHYFWRTHQQQEIDLVIEKNHSYEAFEFKWNRSKTTKPPNRFMQDYTPAAFLTVNPANYQDFLR